MAYTPYTWTDRDSEYPNRRTLTDTRTSEAITADVEKEEGGVYNEGVMFDAETMNDFEARVLQAFEQVQQKINTHLDDIYPIGSIYISISNTSPAVIFGGTWQSISGGILLPSNNCNLTPQGSDSVNVTLSKTQDFSAQVQGALAELPFHRHAISYYHQTHMAEGNEYNYLQVFTAGREDPNTGYNIPDNSSGAGSNYTQQTHTHNFTNGKFSVSGNISYDNRMPSMTVYAWQRTA